MNWKRYLVEYRVIGIVGFRRTFIQDDLRHHQPIYWMMGLGNTERGKRMMVKTAYLTMFPFWLLGKFFTESKNVRHQ